MSVTPIKDLANIGYGGFYIPVGSWLYIYQKTGDSDFLYYLVIVAFGAVIWHSIFRSIFGVEGPERNPKKRLTIAGYSLALMYKREPGGNPKSADELVNRTYDAFSIRRGIRFSVFFFLCIAYFVLALYSLFQLYNISLLSGDFIGSVLFLSQAIFILQGQIFKRFAPVIPPESFKWGYVPEYRRLHENFKEGVDDRDGLFVDAPYILDDIGKTLDELRITGNNDKNQSEMDDTVVEEN